MTATHDASTLALHRRWERIARTVALEETDRTPVVLEYSGFAAQVTGTAMAEFVGSAESSLETMVQAFLEVGGGDAVNYGSFWPYALSYDFMAKVLLPGIELPEDSMWQVVETELMTRGDYRRILDDGWTVFVETFMAERVLNDAPRHLLPPRWEALDVRGRWSKIGVPVLSGGDVTTPIEVLCGARSMVPFFIDLAEIPDVVETVMDAIVPHLAQPVIADAVRLGFPCVWIGGWRGAPRLMSPETWHRFSWRYLRRLTIEVVEAGLTPILHLDSDWTRELERLRELPRARCIVSLDGETDIFRAKRIVGDHLCLMGDVPAALLHGGSPDEVHRYSRRLIRELGPAGFILQSGCDIPTNAPLANVRAMVAAATASDPDSRTAARG